MKHSIKFTLLPKPRRDGSYTIRMRLSWNSIRYDMQLPMGVPVKIWNGNKCKELKGYDVLAKDVNQYIKRLEDNIDALFKEHEERNTVPTVKDVRVALGEKKEENDIEVPLINHVYDEFIRKEGMAKQWSYNTEKNLLTVKTNLYEFNPNLKFSDITVDMINNFVLFLQSKKIKDKTGMSNHSIDSLMHKFRRFMKWAYENHYTEDLTWNTYKPKFHYAFDEPIYLRPEEIHAVETVDLSPRLALTRDTFIFCCFSGLRYSDVSQLRKSQIHEDYFEIITEKTDDTLSIELNDHTKAILDKYKNTPGPYALPVSTNQKVNYNLKRIGKIAGLNRVITKTIYKGRTKEVEEKTLAEYLTFHIARKTFVTMALFLDIKPEVFMKWTGHKKFTSVKRYMGIVDELRKESMNKFNKL